MVTDDGSSATFSAHLDGEALHVALLIPEKVRERWKDLVDGLSEYYNSPGRLAVFPRRFDNACRRPGLDLATFATAELGILAVDLMIRNKFITAQKSCELRRYLAELQRMLPLETLWIVVEFGKVTRRPDTLGVIDKIWMGVCQFRR